MPSDAPVLPPDERELIVSLLCGRAFARAEDTQTRIGPMLDRLAHDGYIEHRMLGPDDPIPFGALGAAAGLTAEDSDAEITIWEVEATSLGHAVALRVATEHELRQAWWALQILGRAALADAAWSELHRRDRSQPQHAN